MITGRAGSIVAALGILAGAAGLAPARGAQALRLLQTIPLPGVEGRLDHMALDAAGQRLFLAALGNHTVEVIDLRAGRRTRSLTGFHEPQGVAFLPAPPRLVVADGGDGTCRVLDGATLTLLRTIRLGEDADNVRVDEAARRVYVGFGSGALAVLDGVTGDSLGRVGLPAHPESFQLEDHGTRIVVNVPEAGEVTVADRLTRAVVAHWRLEGAGSNYPMVLEPGGRRLLVGCRRPARLIVLDTTSGRAVAAVPLDGDVDDLAFDARTRRLYASCGAGFLDVVAVPDTGAIRVLARVPGAAGARTSYFDEARGRLYLAVPRRGRQPAAIRVFGVAAPPTRPPSGS